MKRRHINRHEYATTTSVPSQADLTVGNSTLIQRKSWLIGPDWKKLNSLQHLTRTNTETLVSLWLKGKLLCCMTLVVGYSEIPVPLSFTEEFRNKKPWQRWDNKMTMLKLLLVFRFRVIRNRTIRTLKYRSPDQNSTIYLSVYIEIFLF